MGDGEIWIDLDYVGNVSRATIFMVGAQRVKGTSGSPWQKTEKV